jgi:SAM-dependent methyltransferase
VQLDASVLDVGSGAGRFLYGLRALGFTGRLVGVDPFLPDEHGSEKEISLYRMGIEAVTGRFDVITLIHTLEHVVDQLGALRHIGRLLAPDGISLISIPVAGGWAWEHYRENWVQLDPPRHIVLHTERSLRVLAAAAGLKVRDTIWDSTSFQIWGSEFVKRNKPIVPWSRAFLRAGWRIPFDAVRAARLNREGRGDQATFVLSR